MDSPASRVTEWITKHMINDFNRELPDLVQYSAIGLQALRLESRRDKGASDSPPFNPFGTWRFKKVSNGPPGDAIARENSKSVPSQLYPHSDALHLYGSELSYFQCQYRKR